MFVPWWRHAKPSRSHRKPRPAAARRRPSVQPLVEILENRQLPSTFTVTTNADSGSGSLRDAIQQANANTGTTNTITFALTPGSASVIAPTSALPTIVNPVDIDGTQASSGSVPTVVLTGASAGSVHGLILGPGSSGSTIKGLDIEDFFGDAILIQSSNNTIETDYLGTDPTGTTAAPNAVGVDIQGGANNSIGVVSATGGNVISGNTYFGVRILANGATANIVQGNLIGTDVTGLHAVPNGLDGVILQAGASHNLIGVTQLNNTTLGNEISGNGVFGIYITDPTTTGNVIQTNLLGTDRTGSVALPNGGAGISLSNAVSNTIGGTTMAQANLISGNAAFGVELAGSATTGNLIQDNGIGTDISGTATVPNTLFGIVLFQGSGNTIGGSTSGTGNVVSGNGEFGIFLFESSGNVVQGNLIGTDKNGTAGQGNSFDGITLFGSNQNTIGGTLAGEGNTIAANHRFGMFFAESATGNVVQGNLIGTDKNGSTAVGNYVGVAVSDSSSNNTIGGTIAAARNVISGSGAFGVLIDGVSGTELQGNYIGTDVNGSIALANGFDGVALSGATDNTIGGTAPGAGNVIAGNDRFGIYLVGSGTTDNVVQQNTIGLSVGGSPLPNADDGVALFDGASDNYIGGAAVAAAGQSNTIQDNGRFGVFLDGPTTTGNRIEGNNIGSSTSGGPEVGGQLDGVVDFFAPGNTIGGTVAAHGNIISGNKQNGVLLAGPTAFGNLVEGNFIGTDGFAGTAIANGGSGIVLAAGATDNTIGGTTSALANFISGNTGNGIDISDPGTLGNVVEGNSIGVNNTGRTALANALDGVFLQNGASGNTIGGTGTGAGNLISGNTGNGVDIDVAAVISTTINNLVVGNLIGTDLNGTAAVPNHQNGVLINNEADNTIGGTTAGSANVISGNTGDGVQITGFAATGNVVQGNLIGTDVNGSVAVANGGNGVEVLAGAAQNLIGGSVVSLQRVLPSEETIVKVITPTLGGSGSLAGNLISGNKGSGIHFGGTATSANLVEGNLIGTDVTGTVVLGNLMDGIFVDTGATRNTIGGTVAAALNLISGNGTVIGGTLVAAGTGFGIRIDGAATAQNVVEGNFIGTDVNGSTSLTNDAAGVGITDAAFSNTIGGSVAGAGNVIGGRTPLGIAEVDIDSGSGNVVQGNSIGVDRSGTINLNSDTADVLLTNGAQNNLIGGTVAGEGNTIAGAGSDGLHITGTGTTGNLVQGNLIGTTTSGGVTNFLAGVFIENGAADNTIGGTVAGAGNVIAHNSQVVVGSAGGVIVGNSATDSGTTGNAILGNSIFDNSGTQGEDLGIDLGNDRVTPNGSGPTGPNDFQDFPVITSAVSDGAGGVTIDFSLTVAAGVNYRVEFFVNDAASPSGFGEGQSFLGATTVFSSVSGTFPQQVTFPAGSGVNAGQIITATATDSLGNTSEFSAAGSAATVLTPG